NGDAVSYLLVHGPDGMTVDAATGLVTWQPTRGASRPQADVVLLAYDSQGAHTSQEFTIQVSGVNSAPVFAALASEIHGQEGEPLVVPASATDADGDVLVYRADRLPPGAVFDADEHVLQWTPAQGAAGAYDVRFVVSDGLHEVSQATTLLIAP